MKHQILVFFALILSSITFSFAEGEVTILHYQDIMQITLKQGVLSHLEFPEPISKKVFSSFKTRGEAPEISIKRHGQNVILQVNSKNDGDIYFFGEDDDSGNGTVYHIEVKVTEYDSFDQKVKIEGSSRSSIATDLSGAEYAGIEEMVGILRGLLTNQMNPNQVMEISNAKVGQIARLGDKAKVVYGKSYQFANYTVQELFFENIGTSNLEIPVQKIYFPNLKMIHSELKSLKPSEKTTLRLVFKKIN